MKQKHSIKLKIANTIPNSDNKQTFFFFDALDLETLTKEYYKS
jgi:hypothetical protein